MSSMEPVRSGLRLRVVEGGYHTEYHPLERALISIGRSTPETVASASYLTFPEPTVSRLHAVLTWEAGAKAYLVHHRSQTNPTVLNSAVLNGPVLLKAGDRITLGRLVLLVEPDQEAPTPSAPAPEMAATAGGMTLTSAPAVAAPPVAPATELCLNARQDGGERTFSAPVRSTMVALNFSNERATAAVAGAGSQEGWQEVRLPGATASSLRFHLDPSAATCQVEIGSANQPQAHRLSSRRGGGELSVPLRTGQTLALLDSDVLVHQGYRIWLGSPDQTPEAASTLSQKPTPSEPGSADETSPLQLHFLNGPWKDARLSLPYERANLRLGPGDIGSSHPFPVTRAPQAEITIQAGAARLRASDVPDDQFLEVDGDLVFPGESVPLVGGSRLMLGEAEFLWTDGSEAHYGAYRLRDGEATYPLRKASVRLGTAAHCEIILPHRELPPVIGRLTFDKGVPHYLHTDLSATVRVDGEELSPGLSVPLRAGSELELKPGLLLQLEHDPLKT